MSFSEKIKLEVKQKAAFMCCRCRNIGIEVHHIIPSIERGSDEINNAAPLCAKCHADFGDNPKKRTEITQMRDWWYKTVKKTIASGASIIPQISIISDIVVQIQKNPESPNKEPLLKLKSALHEYVDSIEMPSPESLHKTIDVITPSTAQVSSSGIVNVTIPMSRVNISADVDGEHASLLSFDAADDNETEDDMNSEGLP